jgi:toxin ParE1/3/4
MKMVFEPAARNEFLRAIRWYATEAGVARATSSEAEVRKTLTLIQENSHLGSSAPFGLRQFPLRRHPFTLFYRPEPDTLRIIAVAHQTRLPNYWAGRV